MRNVARLGLRLLLIALVAGVLLGVTDYFTRGPIKTQELARAEQARKDAFAAADSFELLTDAALSGDVKEIYQAKKAGMSAGYVVSVAPKGYGGAITMTVGVDPSGTVVGVIIGSNSETPGLGKRASEPSFYNQYVGKSGTFSLKDDGNTKIDGLTGATISSRAVTSGVNQAVEAAMQCEKGESAK
ncbi:MAG: RnfABCDGE type electron transport complex subunit G [Eubacteriales bacterium]|nr:RnfABCDGE type electron transport complex subunit G [Eubacteriales bacterium]